MRIDMQVRIFPVGYVQCLRRAKLRQRELQMLESTALYGVLHAVNIRPLLPVPSAACCESWCR